MSGRKARHFTETGALPILTMTELGPGNQAHAREVGTHQAISRIHVRKTPTFKTLETEKQKDNQSISPSQF